MTTYLGEKAVGVGTVKATMNVGKVITDEKTVLGDGFTEPLAVNTLLFATSESVAASAEAVRTEFDGKLKTVEESKASKETVKLLNFAVNDINDALDDKQDKLTAGENITIEDGVISATGGGGSDVDLSNYVQKTDIATVSTPGLVAASNRTKFVVFANTGEVVCTSVQSINEADKLDQNAFISKGTLETLKYLYVKQGIAENTYTLTDTEKQKVRNWIGVSDEDIQKETMPSSATVGTIVQYIGETNKTYTNGYFYKYAFLGEGYTTNATSTITSFDFDQFWADVEAAGYTLESLGLDEATKAKGGFRIMGVIRSETVMDLLQINGVTVSLSTESMTFGSNLGQRLTFSYQTGKIYEWQQIDVQPVPEVGGDYLPLSGGTLEPKAAIGFVEYAGGTVHTLSVSSVNALATSGSFQCGRLYPRVPKNTNIGDSVYRWQTIYVAKINNGADIAVPTTGGTMALKEDIDAAVGDISTALTAILGE